MKEGAPAEPRSAPRSSESVAAAPGAAPATNFEYDDNEWDVGIGDLIIDLDADIEKNNDAAPAAAAAPDARMGVRQQHSSSMEKGLKMKIKRTSKPGRSSEAKHEIVQVESKAAAAAAGAGAGAAAAAAAAATSDASEAPAAKAAAKAVGKRAVHKKERRDKEAPLVKAERRENGVGDGDEEATSAGEADSPDAAPSPQAKRQKTDAPTQSGVSDMCVGTDGHISQGTELEPDSLGPCEPGTTVNLEGIVWQETQGGVLVVNVTWRGKTYVGTLLDYTRHHDWAPPRFNDSPTAELEARGGKGRGKRGRGAASAAEPTVAETRASVQSKLRSQGKGRRGTANSAGANFTAPASPVKRKGRAADREVAAADKTPNKRSRTSSNTSQSEPASSAPGTPEPPPTPGTPCGAALAPLIECPETGCSKKYRHVNGLRYHQSHAHSNGLSEGERETGESSAPESPPAPKTPPPVSVAVTAPAQSAPPTPPAPASPLPVTAAAVPATSPVTPATPAPAAPPVAAPAPPNGAAAPAKPGKPAAPVSAAVAPQSLLTGLADPAPTAGEPPPAELRPTHAKVQISDSNGNVKTSSVLRFGPTALPAAPAAAPGSAVLAGAQAPLRTAASVYQPAAPPPPPGSVARPAAAVTVSVSTAARTIPVVAAIDASKYKAKSVAARVPASGLPVVTVPPAGGSYGQSVSHLKPIQPKPTILGETSPINPALESLRKEKERPKKRRKENGVRTPEASPRPDGTEPIRAAPRVTVASGAAPIVVSSSVPSAVVSAMARGAATGVVFSAAPGGAGPGAPHGVPSGAPGPAERPSRDGTASPAYSDISDDGAPVDVAGRPPVAPVRAAVGDKKDLAGALPQSSVYYHSFFQPPGVFVPPPAAGKPGGTGPDGADGKDGPRGPAVAGATPEYPGGQVPYFSYPYLPAAYQYPPLDPAGFPLPVMVDPKYKVALGGERAPASGGAGGAGGAAADRRDAASDGDSGRTSVPPLTEPRAAHTGAASGRDASPQPAPAHRPALATPPRAGGQSRAPTPASAAAKRPPPTSSAGPPASSASPADKRPSEAAVRAALAPAFGYPAFGLPGLAGLPYGPVMLNGGYPARFPVSSAAAVSAAPEDLSRAAYTAASRASEVRGALYPSPAHRLLEMQERAMMTPSSAAASSAAGAGAAAGRAGSPGSPLSAPLRPPLPAGLGFLPPGGYNPYTGVSGSGASPGYAPIK